jgi:uncharacterized RDD family membrane protein YckC
MLRYDAHYESLEACYDKYEEAYGIDLGISNEDYEKLSDEVKQKYLDAGEKMQTDVEIRARYDIVVNLVLIITVFSIMLGFFIMEFIVPLCFGNGQTLGKKIFGIAVMHTNGVKLSTPMLFARTVLGKYTVETMIPVMIVILIYFNMMGFFGTLLLMILGFVQVMLLILTHTRSPIHDLVAKTVTVDFASQMNFDSEEALLAYKTKLHEEKARRAEYP